MTQLKLSLSGPFSASWQGAVVTRFQSDKVRALLAYLAIEGERPVRRETLATLLWPAWTDDKAKRNLRQNLHRLKQVLDDLAPGFSEHLLEINRQTIQIDRTWLLLDVAEFQAALTAVETHAHRHLHTCDSCLEQLTAAVALVHGGLLAQFSLPDAPLFEEWLAIQREQLHYQSMQALYRLSAAHALRGEHALAYTYAVRQLELEPWREEAHRQAMMALARQGKRRDALAQYEACCRVLDTELAINPAVNTVALYTQIRNDTLAAEVDMTVPLHHFPAQFTRFVGRGEEIAAVSAHLLDPHGRLLTLIGPGGIGKTRLSLRAVEHLVEGEAGAAYQLFPDGIYFIPLADVISCDQLITALARALDIALQAAGNSEQHVINYLSGKNLLLVLDNFEQLVHVAPFMARLLQSSPHTHCLITSREPLNIEAEQKMWLSGLAYPEADLEESELRPEPYAAMRLFIQTARHLQPDFQPDSASLQAIARICQLTQGTPLALEIAAAWVRLMDCEMIAQQIGRSLDFLEASWRDIPARHRSMRAVFEQSWEFLDKTEQVALTQLALFRGGFTLEAAVSVTKATAFHLTSLLDKSFLKRHESGRYILHELVQQFAREKQDAFPPLTQEGATAHSAYFLTWMRSQGSALFGPNAKVVMGRIRLEQNNLHLAWETAVAQNRWPLIQASVASFTHYHMLSGQFAAISGALGHAAALVDEGEILGAHLALYQAHVLLEQGQLPEAHKLIERVLTLADADLYPALYARTCEENGRLLELQGDYPAALERLEVALDYYQQAGNKIRQSRITNVIGNLYWRQSLYDQALSHYQQALSITEEIGDKAYRSVIFGNLGIVYVEKSVFDKGAHYYHQALQIDTDLGNRAGIARHTHNIARIYRLQGRLQAAMDYFEKALAIAEEMGIQRGVSLCAINIGVIHKELGDYQQAEVYYQRALRISQALGLKEGIVNGLGNLGNLYRLMARFDEAQSYYEQSLKIAKEIGFAEGAARQLGNIAMVYKAQERWTEADETFDQAIAMLREIKEIYYISSLLIERGGVLMALGAYEAAQLFTEEGVGFAEQGERRNYLFDGRLQLARIAAATGRGDAAQQQLQALLAQTADPQDRATIEEALQEIVLSLG